MTLQQWLAQWQHKSAAVQARVNTALDFLTTHYGADKPDKILSEIQSTCAPAADTWSIDQKKTLVNGGGVQYLIPRMNRYLRYVA